MKANKITNLKTAIVDFIRSQKLFLVVIEAFSRLNHQFSLFFFQDKKWKNVSKNFSNTLSRHNPCYLLLPMFMLSFGIASSSSKISNEPIDQSLIGVAYGNISGEVNSCSIDFISLSDALRFSLHDSLIIHGNSSLAIHNASEIAKLMYMVFHTLVVCHTDNIKIYRERLNSGTPSIGRCDSLDSLVTMRGNAEELPRLKEQGQKSNSARTAATVPLTDGQTPPGDQLSVTDFKAQIQWYGSFVTINGSGDINKSDLIDLELLAA